MYNACITISSLVPDLQVSGSSVGEDDTHGTHKIEKHTHTGEGYTQPNIHKFGFRHECYWLGIV